MQDSRPSATAYRVAFRRAAHQILDHPQVFQDELAIRILGPDTREKVVQSIEQHQQPASRALRAFVSARSRYAEDKLAHAVSLGIRQYVLLGAGLDTFAYRHRYPDLRVFEADHPATQGWKIELLANSQIPIPDSLTFTAVDFERDSLPERLEASGFRADLPAFFAWLGVTPHLTLEAFRITLRFLGSLPIGTGVAFDYGLARHLLNPAQLLALDALSKRVESAGEPFQLFFTPAELQNELREAGFTEIEDLDEEVIRSRYFANRKDGLSVGSVARMASAWKNRGQNS